MKTILMLFMTISLASMSTYAQNSKNTMTERAEELHQTIKSKDKVLHEKFVNENYSQEFLDKVEISRHTGMLERLHKDFSDSKVVSINVKENKVIMLIERKGDKHQVTFDISFDSKDNYKINGMGIEAGEL